MTGSELRQISVAMVTMSQATINGRSFVDLENVFQVLKSHLEPGTGSVEISRNDESQVWTVEYYPIQKGGAQ